MTLRARLAKLEAQTAAAAVGRLFVLIPDLWPEHDRTAFKALGGAALDDLVERRTGVRPVPMPGRIWAIVMPMHEEGRAWDDAAKAAYLEAHETRPLAQWQRKETP